MDHPPGKCAPANSKLEKINKHSGIIWRTLLYCAVKGNIIKLLKVRNATFIKTEPFHRRENRCKKMERARSERILPD